LVFIIKAQLVGAHDFIDPELLCEKRIRQPAANNNQNREKRISKTHCLFKKNIISTFDTY